MTVLVSGPYDGPSGGNWLLIMSQGPVIRCYQIHISAKRLLKELRTVSLNWRGSRMFRCRANEAHLIHVPLFSFNIAVVLRLAHCAVKSYISPGNCLYSYTRCKFRAAPPKRSTLDTNQ